ncbi:interferon-induced very large GTPase 1-like [Erpetoichthys calabaricus]|uniref:interferon-induced very large GTPase 1-like n=1 Tax=Erpetoichthys calabaricus TaxID=27687 RepID=UPI00109F0DF3|nr:interferon-induced very large GTPase 1-like [Erpetoichthys calabaricus]XP_051790663.1 interferon-induced very large GTPase 1-like [Erpetoichthys calabaricus]XP_051790664.1 interferon-induced very large GTPase 1-like [Erpetoichthys calabaricus]
MSFQPQSTHQLVSISQSGPHSDPQVQDVCYCGPALCGILLSNNPPDLQKKRSEMICDHGMCIHQNNKTWEMKKMFESCSKEHIYKSMMETMKATLDDCGIYVDEELGSYSAGRDLREDNKPFLCLWKRYEVALEKCTFKWRDLHLSGALICELKKLESLCTEEKKNKQCKAILEKYGSHISTSNTFGGIYWLRVESSDFTEGSKETREQLIRKITEVQHDVHSFTDISEMKSLLQSEYGESHLENTSISIQTVGGPADCYTFEKWRRGLLEAKDTWKVIDHGALHQLVPLWKIMSLNHKADFQSCASAANVIKTYWETETGLLDFSHELQNLLEAEEILQNLPEKVEIWNQTDSLTMMTCIEYVTECTRVHFKILVSQSASGFVWEKLFLYNRNIQTWLVKMVNFLTSPDTSHPVVRVLLQQVTDFFGEYGIRELEGLESLKRFLPTIKKHEEILNIQSVKDQLSQMKTYATLEDPLTEAAQQICNNKVRCSLLKLKDIVGKTGEQYHQSLVTLLFYKYIRKGDVLLKMTDWEVIIDKVNELEHHFNNLKSMDKDEGEAFVILMALKKAERLLNTKEQEAIELINIIKDEMGSNLCPEIQEILNQGGEPKLNLQQMRDKLNSIINKCIKDKEMQQKNINKIKPLACKSPNSTVQFQQLESQPLNTNEIIELLGLDKFCKVKQTVRQIKKFHNLEFLYSSPPELVNVPGYFIGRLMMLHSNTMNLKCLKPQTHPEVTEKESVTEDENDDWFGDTNDNKLNVNPLDVVVAVFMCSDLFVQQELAVKMSLCQYAIPLLLPTTNKTNTFLLWAVSAVQKKWKRKSTEKESCVTDKRLATYPMAHVTFIRLGDLQRSKSAFLNALLGSSEFQSNIFIHSDMECGDIQRKISSGLIELTWHLPLEKEQLDVFSTPCCILNLRGDAKLFSKHVAFLTEVSSVICLFVDNIGDEEEKLISALQRLKGKVFLLVNPRNSNLQENGRRLSRLKSTLNITKDQVLIRTKKNDSEFISVVRSAISNVLTSEPRTMSLEKMAEDAKRFGFNIDEDYAPCQTGKEKANVVLRNLKQRTCDEFQQKKSPNEGDEAEDITCEFNQESIPKFKKKTFPFQGEFWCEYSEIDKESWRLKNIGQKMPCEYTKELNQKKKKIRQKQMEKDISVSVEKFIEALMSTSEERLFFLHWMKMYLDSLSADVLPEIQRQLMNCKDENRKKALLEKFSNSSVGLKHFLREIGQIYEAFVATETKLKSDLSSLPSVAAEILLDGVPIELIDGNVSDIPLRWVSDILAEVQNKTHPDTRIYVLSVLGVQSSGKSTLLNTLFGLQFAAGTGRCTRGAFMQLIHLDDNVKEELGCDYILVIDTEGLRAPELLNSKNIYEQDNEMATLIIGLSDIILVTLSSENITEMQDILQIVVHAMIRMKETGKKPNIYFIHNNVSDVSADVKNMSGNRKLLEQLDIVTRAAAKQENKEKTYSRFSDVIQYDPSKINIYIPGLWRGIPPMAAVSNGYSKKIYELKTELLECMKKKKVAYRPMSITNYIRSMVDLSNAVKSEDFIFSFQNSLAAEAFAKLSNQCNNWKWEIQQSFMEWREGAEMRNKSCEEPDSLESQLSKEAGDLAKEKEELYLKKLTDYYKCDVENKQYIERDKQYFEVNIKGLCQQYRDTALMGCKTLMKNCRRVNTIMKRYKEKIKERFNNLVKECKEGKSKVLEAELHKEFEKMWKETLGSLERLVIEVDIRYDMEVSLLQSDPTRSKDIKEKLRRRGLHEWGNKEFIADDEPPKDENDSKRQWNLLKPMNGITRMAGGIKEYTKSVFNRGAHETQRTADMVISTCVKYINTLVNRDADYDPSLCMGVIKEIERQMKTLGDEKREMIDHLQVDIKLHVCGSAVQRFQEMHRRFISKIDPLSRLEERKQIYWEMFSDLYHERDESQRAAKMFCDFCLKESLIRGIESQLSKRIVSDMRETWAPLKLRNIPNFQLALLISLHESESFKDYKEYITDYDGYAQRWLFKEVVEYCKTMVDCKMRLHSMEEEIMCNMMGKVKETLKDVKESQIKTAEDFLTHFIKAIKKRQVWIIKENLDVINLKNVKQFEVELSEAINELEKELKNQITRSDVEGKLNNLSSPPHEQLFELLKGCGEKCPYCGTPCELDGQNHQHYSRYHWAFGVSNASPHYLKSKSVIRNMLWVFDQRTMNCVCQNYQARRHNTEINYWGELYKDDTSLYWQFVLNKYKEDFATFYKTKPVRFIGTFIVNWEDVKGDLENKYKISLEDLRVKHRMELL